MKWIIYIFSLVLFASCAVSSGSGQKAKGSNIITEQDENEYAIIIDDPKFDSWLATYGYPVNYYSNDYYKRKNETLVSDWNSRFTGRFPYDFNINYDYGTDYGFDVNYQLFHYFKYMSQKYGINLPGI